MNEQSKQGESPASRQGEPDVIALIRKMQEHLVILERKIDSLINKPQDRPFKEKHFSKPPFRPFNPSRRHDKEEYGRGPRRGSHDERPPFKKHRDEDNRGYGPKKPFFSKRKDKNKSY